MTAERKAIRQAMASLLVGKTAAADRVFANRTAPLWEAELPAIIVYTRSEASRILDAAAKRYERTVSLSVECVAQAVNDVDDVLDDMAEAIEQAVAADDTLAGTASDVEVTSTELEVVETGEKPMAALRLNFAARYVKYAPPELPLDAFETAQVEYDVPVHGNVDAADTVELPQV